MAWTPVLLMFLTHGKGSLSQPVLTQPPSLSVPPGTTARLACTLSRDISVGSYYKTDTSRSQGALLDSDKYQGSSVPSHFSGSKDAPANAGPLLILGLQAEKGTDYYCQIWHSSVVTGTHTDGEGWLRFTVSRDKALGCEMLCEDAEKGNVPLPTLCSVIGLSGKLSLHHTGASTSLGKAGPVGYFSIPVLPTHDFGRSREAHLKPIPQQED
ncbi:hypothetical protein GH733_015970 [Mirounga leonina]|nr:hypothetical protein GH733_015970 [Mirounga leonina]